MSQRLVWVVVGWAVRGHAAEHAMLDRHWAEICGGSVRSARRKGGSFMSQSSSAQQLSRGKLAPEIECIWREMWKRLPSLPATLPAPACLSLPHRRPPQADSMLVHVSRRAALWLATRSTSQDTALQETRASFFFFPLVVCFLYSRAATFLSQIWRDGSRT